MSFTQSVVISCAGIGSRLGLGQTKALIKINGESLISQQLSLLKEVEDIRIVIGFQANDVIREVKRIRKDAIFIYNHRYFETKTGASFYLGARHANEYVIEWDGDLLVHPDDVKLILNTPGEFICYTDVCSEQAVFLDTDDEGNVTSFSQKAGSYEWTGPACMRRDRILSDKIHVFNQLEPYLPLKGLKIRAHDIDTHADYLSALEFVKTW